MGIIRGNNRANMLAGTSRDDTIFGLGADDTLNGRGGADVLLPGRGNDTVDGGSGKDTVSYADISTGVTVSLAAYYYGQSTGVGTLTMTDIENLTGGDGDDTLTGDYYANRLSGGRGDDTLEGGGGGDLLDGGAGNDTLRDGNDSSRDRYIGGAGDDLFVVGYGDDRFIGGTGSDTVSFENSYYAVTVRLGGTERIDYYSSVYRLTIAEVENVVGGSGADTLVGDGAANSLAGGSGDDTIEGGGGGDRLAGGAGTDVLRGGAGFDIASYAAATTGVRVSLARSGAQTVSSGEGTDTLVGIEGLEGGAGRDRLTGDNGANTLIGGASGDVLDGGLGRDTARFTDAAGVTVNLLVKTAQDTGEGLDRLVSIENLAGGSGNDWLTGDGRDNELSGGGGDDVLRGNAGRDLLDGKGGFDVADYSNAGARVTISLGNAGWQSTGAAGVDRLVGIEGVAGGSAADRLLGSRHDDLLIGNGAADMMQGLGGYDRLRGGIGNDRLDGGVGSDTADYADSRRSVHVDLSKAMQRTGGGGTDRFVSIENVAGGSGDDRLFGSRGDNDLSGGRGNDLLIGGDGKDRLFGGDGNDVLNAGSGNGQRLVGGAGSDTYILGRERGSGVIEDVLGTADTLDASGAAARARVDLGIGEASIAQHYTLKIANTGVSTLPVDMVFAQDLSGSFSNDIANVRAVAPEIVSEIRSVNRESAFGVVGFVDKPMSPFGSPGDYVYDVLQRVTHDGDAVGSTYGAMSILSGNDGPEAQVEALFQIAKHADDTVGFRSDSVRVVVLFTDATFHVAGDGRIYGLKPNDGDGQTERNGTAEDYPTIAQLKNALQGAGILPVFAVQDVEDEYRGLVNRLGFGAVVSLSDDSENVVAAIRRAATVASSTAIERAIGTRFNDEIRGNTLDNVLDGGKGRDALYGLFGDDRLIGGAAADRMTGGDGRDRFIFEAASDSTAGARDRILDFHIGRDRIDLSAIDADRSRGGNQTFDFDRSGHAGRGEVTFDVRGGHILVTANTDKDGAPEIEIMVDIAGRGVLHQSDFVL